MLFGATGGLHGLYLRAYLTDDGPDMQHPAEKFDPLKAPSNFDARRDPEPGDLRDGSIYVYNSAVVDAVKVAIAANRPLLVSGVPGSGKSSLAPNVARQLGYRYYSLVVSSRMQANDLLWTFDAVRRLGDAQTQHLKARYEHYVEPGVLWWAFDPESARLRGLTHAQIDAPDYAREPDILSLAKPSDAPAVVLIDEIDKADPDVPNDLLVPFGSYEFALPSSLVRAKSKPLVILTTNGERELPPAFRRRCIELALQAPDAQHLVEIAKHHFGLVDEKIYGVIADRTCEAAKELTARRERPPSTAEFLDAIHAWRGLRDGADSSGTLLDTIMKLTIWKHPELESGSA
jgi:MoxR-like ATPase